MIKIKSENLKEFFKKSKFIKPALSNPVLSNIKVECAGNTCKLTKTNLNHYCIYDTKIENNYDGSFLLNERDIASFINSINPEYITIQLEEKRLIISDGNKTKKFSEMEDVNNFPVYKKEIEEAVNIPRDVIESLYIAKEYAKKDMVGHPASFVHLKNNEVFASNAFAAYYKKFNYDLPEILFYPEMCFALVGLGNVGYYKSGNYSVFTAENILFGFISTEASPMDYGRVIGVLVNSKGFTIDKAELIKFCEFTINSATNENPISALKNSNGEFISIEFNGSLGMGGTKMEVEVVKEGEIIEYNFNPKILLPGLKAIPYDYIHITQNPKYGIIIHNEHDLDYAGVFMPFIK